MLTFRFVKYKEQGESDAFVRQGVMYTLETEIGAYTKITVYATESDIGTVYYVSKNDSKNDRQHPFDACFVMNDIGKTIDTIRPPKDK